MCADESRPLTHTDYVFLFRSYEWVRIGNNTIEVSLYLIPFLKVCPASLSVLANSASVDTHSITS